MYLETLATLKGYQTLRMKENNSSISNNILKSQSTRRVTKHIPLQGQITNPPDRGFVIIPPQIKFLKRSKIATQTSV